MVARLPVHFKTSIRSCMMIKLTTMRLWKKSQGVSPSISPSTCHSYSVQRNNSGSDNGTNFVGNKHCGLEDRQEGWRGVHQERGEHLEPHQLQYFFNVISMLLST